ncbi:MAG: redox-regulated ATPase YchF [Erysipelotrichaceae bacterium]|nr:redox-regulated ATPase YchF [Erysipelotrichaceae bacterium]MCI9525248.1 redox-regulated ATPase YchF [Erysipelotrichaceae bacterium]
MPLTAGIVGLPNVGKSTLFNAITKSQVEAANYPFATIQPNVGVVEVPDDRVDRLVELFHPKKTIYTTFEFTDIAGLVKGASKGEGLGNQFLSNIRLTDAICHVVRCFDDADITHVEGSVDPIRDIEIINLELIMADLATVENRISKIERKAKTNKEKDALAELALMEKLRESLESGKPARSVELDDDDRERIKAFSLLTLKPMIYVANMSEEEIVNPNENAYYQRVCELAQDEHNLVVPVCAKIEEELSELDKEEKQEFLQDLGIAESGLDHVIKAAYRILDLCTFLTAGEDECRAWTFKKGMKAPQCAGIIHTDFEKGFIRAECYSFADIDQLESEHAIKEAGKLRLEGKEYIVQDGDVLHFRFAL